MRNSSASERNTTSSPRSRARPTGGAHDAEQSTGAAPRAQALCADRSFVSAAPRARLLAVLRQLKPQLNLRLRTGARERDGQRYDVDVDIRDLQVRHLIDPWLGIKCALAAAFPENEPDGIRRLQP